MYFIRNMIINTYNFNNKKYTNYNFQNKNLYFSKNINFKGSTGILNYKIADNIASIGKAFGDILNILSQKTDKGIEFIEKNCDFEFKRSMVFHNCGHDKNTILINIPENKQAKNFIKIVVKKGKEYPNNRIFLHSYAISDFNKILKDENPNIAYSFPNKNEYLNQEELKNKNIELNLENTLSDLDIAMLNLRKFLNKISTEFLKPEIFKLENKNLENLKSIDYLYKQTDDLLKNIPSRLSNNLRSNYGDYKLQAKQSSHILTNIGDLQNQIVYKKLEHPLHGTLTRLMIYTPDNKIADGFLINKDYKVVSNFNVKNFDIIPPKLNFYDIYSIHSIMPKLENYLDLYKNKLNDFNSYLNKKLYERTITPAIGNIKNESLNNLNNIKNIYDYLYTKFKTIKSPNLSKMKTSYPKWEVKSGQKGFVFNTDDGEKISIIKLSYKNNAPLLRLGFLSEKENKYFLIDANKVVKNYNPKYLQSLPPVLKYYDDIEIEGLDIEKYLQKAFNEIESFKNYYENYSIETNRIKSEIKQNKIRKTIKIKSTPTPKINKIKLSDTNEYKNIMKDCKRQLISAMRTAENNMETFNNTLIQIQRTISEFFEKNK